MYVILKETFSYILDDNFRHSRAGIDAEMNREGDPISR